MTGTGANSTLMDRSATPVQTGTSVKTAGAAQQQVSSTGTVPQSTAGGSATPTATKQSFKRMPHHPNHVTDFNMEKTKFRVFKAIEDKAPPKFRTFFKSGLMDRFLQATLLYFISKFQYQVCINASSPPPASAPCSFEPGCAPCTSVVHGSLAFVRIYSRVHLTVFCLRTHVCMRHIDGESSTGNLRRPERR